MSQPRFWGTPFSYLRWASHNKPAIFYSMVVGSMGPVFLIAVPPIRRYFGDHPREKIPLTYPIPKGPRKVLEGYDDE
ncbi:putative NADH-ubiquinone oxidoreductase 9.5 kDa subunit [Patellaria atrata CBS 101060]|uniref:NADH-ubiquinone oxidoreductase 9.5 kDa subunit n=1 Tax=Patellaria atrata CBS 101060 TaxID=1346257 RepID=A0A9P4VVM7_9PEZI|nr:putative NADH-ubiquinone oxidoreductase 9.5 kDa subunit [Patellaria atrata CBS 101060]